MIIGGRNWFSFAYLADVEESGEGIQRENKISALHRVTSHVSKRPSSLLAHVLILGQKQLDEDGHGAGLDHVLGVVRGAGSDVRERPSSFKLESL